MDSSPEKSCFEQDAEGATFVRLNKPVQMNLSGKRTGNFTFTFCFESPYHGGLFL